MPSIVTPEMIRKAAWQLLRTNMQGRTFIQRLPDGREIEVRIENFTMLNVDPELLAKWEPHAKAVLTAFLEGPLKALERLASTEAFDVARSIDQLRDAELLARTEYARAALASLRSE